MKHSLRNLLCLMLSAMMLIACFVITPSAELTGNEKNSTINGNLTAHWDFEGDTLEEQLKDKAPAGSSDDDLVAQTSGADSITVADGIASIKPDAGTALWLNMSSGSSDVRMTENTTLFIKFRFSGTNSGHADILQMEGLYRIFRHANGDLRVILDSVKDSSGTAITLISPQQISPDQDIYFALVSNANTTAKTFKATMYFSTDGVNYTKTEFSYENMTLSFGGGRGTAKTHGMYIGNHRLKKDPGLDYQYDDIRIYNRSFSAQEVSQITRLDPAAPVVIGSQETAPVGDVQSIRLISAINSKEYTEAGYTVKVRYNNGAEDVEKTLNKSCAAVYKSLTADAGDGIVEISAESLGGTYLLALTIDKVPCNQGKIQFEVTSYAIDEAGRHESIPVLFTYENGDFVSAVKK